MRKPSFIDNLMSETVLYGGLPMRRCDVLRVATEDMGERAPKLYGPDYFAFFPPAVEAEPLTIEQFRAITGTAP